MVIDLNTLESLVSFLVLVSLIQLLVFNLETSKDDSYLHLKLSEDIWRVLYLKNDLKDFNKQGLNSDLDKIYELINLCVVFEEEDVASCIPDSKSSIAIKRVAFINGNPKILTITVGVSND